MSEIAKNFGMVKDKIASAAKRAGRRPEDVELVVVTKTIDIDRIREVIEAGATILGENRVQEARDKIVSINYPVQWHLIGHLQSNKAKYIGGLFNFVHSMDSLSVAEELNKKAGMDNHVIEILVQVNVSGEDSKYGVSIKELSSLVRNIAKLKNLSMQGLMTIPPFLENAEEVRPYFKKLNELREEIIRENIEGINLRHLSMGMSNDFEVAVEEGATMVRVGSAIFGPRPSLGPSNP